MENYAELDAKRARFFVSPFYFVFLRLLLNLEEFKFSEPETGRARI